MQVAVFSDDVSTAHWPVDLGTRTRKLPPYHEPDWNDLNLAMAPATFGALPFPVRHYLLSDLLAPGFSAADIKLAVLLNPTRVSAKLAAAIKAKLQVGNKTVLYSVAVAAVDGDGVATMASGGRDLTGMRGLALGTGSALVRRTTFGDPGPGRPGWPAAAVAAWAPLVGTAAGTHWQATPWWWYNVSAAGPDESALVLGHYEGTALPSLVQVTFADHTSVFSGNPALPAAAIQAVAAAAGVHSYTPVVSPTTRVEAGGNMLVVHHATTSAAAGAGHGIDVASGDEACTVLLPWPATVRFAGNGSVLCSGCVQFVDCGIVTHTQVYTVS